MISFLSTFVDKSSAWCSTPDNNLKLISSVRASAYNATTAYYPAVSMTASNGAAWTPRTRAPWFRSVNLLLYIKFGIWYGLGFRIISWKCLFKPFTYTLTTRCVFVHIRCGVRNLAWGNAESATHLTIESGIVVVVNHLRATHGYHGGDIIQGVIVGNLRTRRGTIVPRRPPLKRIRIIGRALRSCSFTQQFIHAQADS